MRYRKAGQVIILVLMPLVARAESVEVKYRGPVDLKPFACSDVTSSFVRRVCYDRAETYMLIKLQDTWYHYCEIDPATVNALIRAESVGRFYNATVKGRFDCRVHRVPAY